MIFQNLSYDFVPGIYVFSGESGVGKTTLMRAIAGLNTNYTGKIILNGNVISKTTPDIHMVHQHYTSYPWLNLIDNTLMVYKGHKEKITEDARNKAVEILQKLGLGEHMLKKPYQLSGGQDQRLSIASALINDMSPVICYDEMTSALDTENEYKIAGFIREHQARTNNIVIVITHETNVIRLLGGKILNFSEEWRIRE